jgi:hypothetical protein
VDVAVVDRARTATLVRAGAMGHTPRTVEHLRRWGVLQAVREEWTFPPAWNQGIRLITSLAGHELAPYPAVRTLYGADNVLIRPDQHVAWRGSQLPPGGGGAVLDHVLGRHRASKDGTAADGPLVAAGSNG